MRRNVISTALLVAVNLAVASGCGRGDEPRGGVAVEGAAPGAVPQQPAFGDTAVGAGVITDLPMPGDSPAVSSPAAPPTGASQAPGTLAPRTPAAGAPPAGSPAPLPSTPATPAPGTGAGTQTPDASRILQEASDRYAAVRSLRANFTMRTTNPLLRSTTTSRGILYQVRPDRLALRFTDPDGDVIVADGQHFWAYYPSVNAQQVMRSPAGAAGTSGVDLQAQFLGDPVRRFEHTLEGRESVGGREAFVMTMVPRQAADFSRLRVWIDVQDRLVRRFDVTETNGVERRIELDNLQVNPSVPADVFQFSPPPGARVIERG